MTTAMRASFILTLEDKLSSGLNNIKKAFDDLRNKGNQLTLGKLGQGADMLRTVVSEVKNLTSSLSGVSGAADRAWASLKRLAEPRINAVKDWGHRTLGPDSRIGRIGSNIGALGAAAAGYSVYEPIHAYADYENTLRHIAITEKLSGPAVETEISRLNKNLRGEALSSGQNSAELAKAYTFLITTGMSPALVDSLMPTHAKAATAYNISSDSMGQAVFALNDSFKIGHESMGEALSAMAYAAKEAHFTVENFSQFLPAIGGRMSLLGMTGRPAADTAFAALETVVKNSSMPSVAATNFQTLLEYMTAPIATHSFARIGIDLPGMLKAAEKQGINPLDAFLGKLDHLTKGKTQVEAGFIIGKLLHNQEAGTAALSLLQHKDEYLRMRTMLGGVNKSTLDTDFETAFRAPAVQLRIMQEQLDQLNRRIGEGFAPVLKLVNGGLSILLHLVDALDKAFPGMGSRVLAGTGGMLLLTAALGALGVALPAVLTGLETMALLIGGVVGSGLLPLAGIAAVGYEIYDNWAAIEPVVRRVDDAISRFAVSAVGVLRGAFIAALWGVSDAWDWIAQTASDAWSAMVDKALAFPLVSAAIGALSDAWDTVKGAAQSAFTAMDSWTGGVLTDALKGIRDLIKEITDALGSIDKYLGGADWNKALITGGAPGENDGPGGGPTNPQKHQVEIVVHAAPGTAAHVTRSTPGVRVSPNPGQTTERP